MATPQPISTQELDAMRAEFTRWMREPEEYRGLICDRLNRGFAEIEQLAAELTSKAAENTRIRHEVARIVVALDKGEMTVTMDLMDEFYRILGQTPPYSHK